MHAGAGRTAPGNRIIFSSTEPIYWAFYSIDIVFSVLKVSLASPFLSSLFFFFWLRFFCFFDEAFYFFFSFVSSVFVVAH